MFIFGIFEYGRFIMTLQVVQNAAREGARYAVTNTNDATTATVQSQVLNFMAGVDGQLQNYTVTVSGMVLQPQNSSQYDGQPLSDWTTASYTDGISVTVSGNFTPALPSFLQMGTSIPISATAVMYSEGN
jgi:Flp pilus assembly protein TadG